MGWGVIRSERWWRRFRHFWLALWCLYAALCVGFLFRWEVYRYDGTVYYWLNLHHQYGSWAEAYRVHGEQGRIRLICRYYAQEPCVPIGDMRYFLATAPTEQGSASLLFADIFPVNGRKKGSTLDSILHTQLPPYNFSAESRCRLEDATRMVETSLAEALGHPAPLSSCITVPDEEMRGWRFAADMSSILMILFLPLIVLRIGFRLQAVLFPTSQSEHDPDFR